jgi:hypothetical protein
LLPSDSKPGLQLMEQIGRQARVIGTRIPLRKGRDRLRLDVRRPMRRPSTTSATGALTSNFECHATVRTNLGEPWRLNVDSGHAKSSRGRQCDWLDGKEGTVAGLSAVADAACGNVFA